MHSPSTGDVDQDRPPKSVGMHCGTQCKEHRGMSQADFTLITRLCATRGSSMVSYFRVNLNSDVELKIADGWQAHQSGEIYYPSTILMVAIPPCDH